MRHSRPRSHFPSINRYFRSRLNLRQLQVSIETFKILVGSVLMKCHNIPRHSWSTSCSVTAVVLYFSCDKMTIGPRRTLWVKLFGLHVIWVNLGPHLSPFKTILCISFCNILFRKKIIIIWLFFYHFLQVMFICPHRLSGAKKDGSFAIQTGYDSFYILDNFCYFLDFLFYKKHSRQHWTSKTLLLDFSLKTNCFKMIHISQEIANVVTSL